MILNFLISLSHFPSLDWHQRPGQALVREFDWRVGDVKRDSAMIFLMHFTLASYRDFHIMGNKTLGRPVKVDGELGLFSYFESIFASPAGDSVIRNPQSR